MIFKLIQHVLEIFGKANTTVKVDNPELYIDWYNYWDSYEDWDWYDYDDGPYDAYEEKYNPPFFTKRGGY